MKREEKNQLTKKRIMASALAEFSRNGYAASSINTICLSEGVSKGIIYHYFKTKDELFLACVKECFDQLTIYLKDTVHLENDLVEEKLESYFKARTSFFVKHPIYQRIFLIASITPPRHLREEIQACKEPFDRLNIQILEEMLAPVSLRPQISKKDVIDTFRQFQDFINVQYHQEKFEDHESQCRKALNILLYGVIDRKE